MTSEAPFDEDELINDFMETEEQDFLEDEEYMQMMLDEQEATAPLATQPTPPPPPNSSQGQTHPRIVPSQNTLDEEVVTRPLEEVKDDMERESVPMEVSIQAKPPKKDSLYNFESYSGKRQWRTVSKTSEDIDRFEATRWKRRMHENASKKQQQNLEEMNINDTSRLRGNSTRHVSESQLVDFLCQDIYTSLNNTRTRRFRVPTKYQELPIEGEESMPITLSNGSRRYIPKLSILQSTETTRTATTISSSRRNEKFGLLGVPMHEIQKRADKLERRAARKKKRNENDVYDNRSEDDQLWVDKHAPSHFSHLLSNEKVNREVLRALRAWDPYVFKKEPPQRPSYFRNKDNEKDQDHDNNNESENGNRRDIRPESKSRVILLSGAPGVGKTTLAHIITKHAGYRPLEVNASDDRSANVLIDKLMRAMESTTLQFGGKSTDSGKPNCLILDEIDGVDAKSSVLALVDIIRADIPEKNAKGKKNKYLRRPIIFICNQKYSPALKPLLQYAVHFDVSPPTSSRLASRLKSILSKEDIAVVGGSGQLNQLVAETSGDIRSSLYTLQFASSRAREIVRRGRNGGIVDISPVLKSILSGNGVGLKDGRCDAVGTLTTIFQKKKTMQQKSKEPFKSIENVLSTVEHFGDNSKALDSMFTNVISVSYSDPTLDRCWSAHEWLSSGDMYRSFKTPAAMNDTNEHQMMQKFYIPSSAAAVHLLCRIETRPNLNFSTRMMMDAVYKRDGNFSLMNRFTEGLSPSLQNGVSSQIVTTEMLPYFLNLLSANESLSRPVSSVEFLNKNERKEFNMHIQILQALGLTYAGESDSIRSHSDNEMRLEPAIDQLTYFQGIEHARLNKRKEVPSALKILVANQLQMERYRHENSMVSASETVSADKAKENADSMDSASMAPSQNFLDIGAVKARAAKNARKALNVGLSKSKKRKLSNTGSGVPLDEIVRFKYKKGFTQAVRLPCSKHDILF